MRVNVLHDSRMFGRLELLLEELKRQGITDYKIWDSVLSDSVIKSINLSQKQIIQDAKDNGLEEVCLMEDDCYFPNEKGWEYFLSNKPKQYSIYLGGSYWVDNRTQYQTRITKVNQYVGHHCIIVHNSYYDTFLSVPEHLHIDTAQANLGDFYLCYPMAALQRESVSANNNYEVCNYNSVLQPNDIYT